MTLDNQVGDFRLSASDIGSGDFPYGISTIGMLDTIGEEFDVCAGVVRAALKKAKANL